MFWTLLLFFASICTGATYILNKKLSSDDDNSSIFTMTTMAISTLVAVPFLFIDFAIPKHYYTWLLAILSSCIYGVSIYFSFKAYKIIDASVVSIIHKISIVLVALFGILLLRENYSFTSSLGLGLILLSSGLLFYEKQKITIQAGLLFSLLMALFSAIAAILDKIILKDFSSFTYVFVNCLFVFIFFSLPKGNIRKGFRLFQKHKILLFLQSIFAVGSWVIFLFVLKNTDISKTYPIYKSFSLIVPVILGITILKEHSKLLQKIISIIIGSFGIYLLNIR